jgi:hypothetical protein
MKFRRRWRWGWHWFALVAALAIAGCVDHQDNAAEFCGRNTELLAASIDEQGIPTELPQTDDDREFVGEIVEDVEQGFSKTMKYAEDATKAIRNAARDTDDAYLDVHSTITNDDSDPEDLQEDRAQLTEELDRLVELCQPYL